MYDQREHAPPNPTQKPTQITPPMWKTENIALSWQSEFRTLTHIGWVSTRSFHTSEPNSYYVTG